jgi:adenosine kinase
MVDVLVCGSVAIDLIGQYQGSFKQYQENYEIQALNISLQLAEMRSSFGGCGMNITYGLNRLGVNCVPLSAVGANYQDHYQAHLLSLGINTDYIAIDEKYDQCATCILVTDDTGNQITLFHPGAAMSDKRILPGEIEGIENCQLAVLAPEDAKVMIRQARELNRLAIPMIFDPGQVLDKFDQAEIHELIGLSQYAIFNQHEFDMLLTRSGLTEANIRSQLQQVIVTRSEKGVDIYEGTTKTHVDAVPANSILDPTGCGDAFRAGYVYGLILGLEATPCARLGSLMAAENLRSPETQNYSIDSSTLKAAYKTMYQDTY